MKVNHETGFSLSFVRRRCLYLPFLSRASANKGLGSAVFVSSFLSRIFLSFPPQWSIASGEEFGLSDRSQPLIVSKTIPFIVAVISYYSQRKPRPNVDVNRAAVIGEAFKCMSKAIYRCVAFKSMSSTPVSPSLTVISGRI